ncbi:MAG: hypothetical protein U9Q03_01910 [Patescibacteria group bacterium]|nr:hypothetical protein [Patescibacteria group bacterium]
MVAKTSKFWAFVARVEEKVKRNLGLRSDRQQQILFLQISTSWPLDMHDTRDTDRTSGHYDSRHVLAHLARENGAVDEADEMVWNTEDDGYEQDRLAFEAALMQPISPSIPMLFVL